MFLNKNLPKMLIVLLGILLVVEIHGVSDVWKEVTANEYPSVVAVFYVPDPEYTDHICTGTLIASRYTMTLRSCLGGKKLLPPNMFLLTAGNKDMRTIAKNQYGHPNGMNRTADEIHGHPNYRNHPFLLGVRYHDIAAVKTKPFYYSEFIQPVEFYHPLKSKYLQELKRLTRDNKLCYTVGWGATENVGGISVHSPVLLTMKMFMSSNEECEKDLCWSHGLYCGTLELDKNNFLCAKGKKNSRASLCHGDAGNPLFCGMYIFGIAMVMPTTNCSNNIPEIHLGPAELLDFLQNFTGIKTGRADIGAQFSFFLFSVSLFATSYVRQP